MFRNFLRVAEFFEKFALHLAAKPRLGVSRRVVPVFLNLWLLILLQAGLAASENYDAPLNRPYTLRNLEAFPLEAEYHRQLQNSGLKRFRTPQGLLPTSAAPKGQVRPLGTENDMSYTFPRPCLSALDSSRICGNTSRRAGSSKQTPADQAGSGWAFSHDTARARLRLSPVGGAAYRYTAEKVEAFYGGLLARGFTGPLSFYVDARMYTEFHENFSHPSFDREFVERQTEELSGGIAFSSYSRYRSNISLDYPWARITVARDALHWGPGLHENLVFHQHAVPFNQLRLQHHIGPFTVTSVYGQLAIDGGVNFRTLSEGRSLYAHRYEWNATPNLLFGVSEQLILYNTSDAFAFVPIVPLFIAKGTQEERQNNGNIAFDVSLHAWKTLRVYGEFLIDDLLAPTSLFNDFWGNRWALMLGSHYILNFLPGAGMLLEYSRIEPWVYAHYQPNTAQSANQGYSLGNPNGPNSQSLTLKGYSRWMVPMGRIYLGLKTQLLWKGTDLGSGLNDAVTDEVEDNPKRFIYGVGRPEVLVSPHLRWDVLSWMFVEAEARTGENWTALVRGQVWY